MNRNRARITIKLGQAADTKKLEAEQTLKKEEAEEIEARIDLKKPSIETEDEPTVKAKTVFDRLSFESKSLLSKIKAKTFGKGRFALKKDRSSGTDDGPGEASDHLERPRLYRSAHSKSLIGMIASSVGAVAVGMLFGFIVLSFFKSGAMEDAGTVGVPATAIESRMVDDAESSEVVSLNEPTAAGTERKSEPLSVHIPSMTYFVAQGGVFKSEESALTVVEQMKAKGLPSGLSGDEPARLFLGIGVERDHLLAIAANLKEETEVFVKEIASEPKTLSVALKEDAVSSQEEWDRWFEGERAFMSKIGGAISEALSAGQLTAEQLTETKEAHRELLQAGREVVSKLPDAKQSLGNRALNDYTKAMTALEQYQKQPAIGYLWQAQQSLLDAHSNKEKLFASLR